MVMGLGSFASRVVATAVVATDGTGDFTDIQAAIDSLPAGGGVVYIKEGTYAITGALDIRTDNISIIGAGRSTSIETSGNIQCMSIMTAASGNLTGIVISDLSITGSGSGGNNEGIFIRGTKSTLRNLWVESCGDDGINWVAGDGGGTIINCNVKSNSGYGILANPVNIRVINNFISNNGKSGLWIQNWYTVVQGNNINTNVEHGIRGNSVNRSTIVNNTIYGNDSANAATYDGIFLRGNANENTIVGNVCRDNDRYEINISEAACDNNIVVGNVCFGDDHVGAINDTGTATIVDHNQTN